jgi:hypothetical protein
MPDNAMAETELMSDAPEDAEVVSDLRQPIRAVRAQRTCAARPSVQ